MDQWELPGIESDIAELRDSTQKAFKQYQKSQKLFFDKLKLWLLATPILKDEDPEIVEEICQEIKTQIMDEQKITNINDLVGQIARRKIQKYRRKRGREFDPGLVDKLPVKSPKSLGQEELSEKCLKKLSPLHRLLISLSHRGMSKTNISKLLFVTPARVTQYFEEAKKEVQKLCGEISR